MKEIIKLLKNAKTEIVAGLVVAAIIALVSTLFNADLSIIVSVAIIVVWFLSIILYGRKRLVAKGERKRRIKLGHPPNPAYYSEGVRKLALVGVILIPLLSASVWGYIYYKQTLPSENFIILVADFSGPDSEKYRVTETILNRLHNTLKQYDHVVIESLDSSISEQEGSAIARAEGEKRKASIVIWGWYGATQESAPLSINFEILCRVECSPNLRSEVQGEVQVFPISQLNSFTIQSQFADEMTLLSLLTIGLVEYSDKNWDAAISSFTNALNQGEDEISARDVYYYRGLTYMNMKNYDLALNDFSDVIKIDPNYAVAYENLAVLHLIKGDSEQAFSDISQGIILNPHEARLYGTRSGFYILFGKYKLAIDDLDQAITIDPNKASYYQNRGIAYYWIDNYELAMTNMNKAISLYEKQEKPSSSFEVEDFARAYVYRGTIYSTYKDYPSALNEFNHAIKLKPDYANAYHGRAAVYIRMGDRKRAIEDLEMAISLSTDLNRKQQMEEELRKLLLQN